MNIDEISEKPAYKYQQDHFPNRSTLVTEMICDSIATFPQRQEEPTIICAYHILQGQQNNGLSISEFLNSDVNLELAIEKMNLSHKAYNITIHPNPDMNETAPHSPHLNDPDFIYGFGQNAVQEIFDRTKTLFPHRIPQLLKKHDRIDNQRPVGTFPNRKYLNQEIVRTLSEFVRLPDISQALLKNLQSDYERIKREALTHREQFRNQPPF